MERLKMISTTMPYAIEPCPDKNGATEDLNQILEKWVKAENIKDYKILNANMTVLTEWKSMIYSIAVSYTVDQK